MNCTVDNCQREAFYTFVWPWGADGACCEQHKIIVMQQSQQTRGQGARVTFVHLNPDRPREITRDERVALHASRLTAESERDDARLRSSRLLEANTALTNELRGVRARCSSLEATVRELGEQNEVLLRERDAAYVQLETVREEAARLGVVVGEPSEKTNPDLPRNIVEGATPRV